CACTPLCFWGARERPLLRRGSASFDQVPALEEDQPWPRPRQVALLTAMGDQQWSGRGCASRALRGSLPTDEKLTPVPKHVSGIEVTVESVVYVGEVLGVFGGAGGPRWMRSRIASTEPRNQPSFSIHQV